ncbi:MAG: nucleotidyltransferase family protein [Planctomycetota bacterium]
MQQDKQERLDQVSIVSTTEILVALKKMDQLNKKLLAIVDDGRYRGILSAGDIQRAIIANQPLETPVIDVIRQTVRVASADDEFDDIKSMMIQHRTEFMPVLNQEDQLIDIHFWEDVFADRLPAKKRFDIPVVIMAGGKGTRLKPISDILPKALFPLGEKTIVENIMDRFTEAGCHRFFMSVSHKADFIESYFAQTDCPGRSIEFFRETKPLGTAGSLQLIQDRVKERFFVSNCDIIVDTDYSEILDYHVQHKNKITLVAALRHVKIPYGTLDTAEEGRLLRIAEKPEYTHLINAGLYLLEPELLSLIPEDDFFHITDLIDEVMKQEERVGVFPVSEKSWLDIGQWNEYERSMKTLASKL